MRICIVGTGYVGLVSAACFAEMGNDVRCVDVQPRKSWPCSTAGVSIFSSPASKTLSAATGRKAACGLRPALRTDWMTPNLPSSPWARPRVPMAPAIFPLWKAWPARSESTWRGPLIVVDKSTVPVGTADRVRELVAAALAARGEDIAFDVVSNPEFLKEGDAVSVS